MIIYPSNIVSLQECEASGFGGCGFDPCTKKILETISEEVRILLEKKYHRVETKKRKIQNYSL